VSTNENTRREFLGKLGSALSGLVLAGGAGGVSRAQGVLPNGYNFYRIFDANDNKVYPPYYKPNPVAEVSAAVMIASAATNGKGPLDLIYFHGTTTSAFNPDQPTATFQLIMNYSQPTPLIIGLVPFLTPGDSLPYVQGVPSNQLPLIVGTVGTGACNSLGHYATTIVPIDTSSTIPLSSTPGVYLFNPWSSYDTSWTKVAKFGDPVDGGFYGGDFGDVALDDNDNVTFVAATTSNAAPGSSSDNLGSPRRGLPGFAGSQALIHAPNHPSGHHFVVARSGDMLPGTNAVIRGFGLIDVSPDGSFVAQVSAIRVDVLGAQPGTAVITGPITHDRRLGLQKTRLIAASSHLLNSADNRQPPIIGESIIGPRITSRDVIGLVTHAETTSGSLGGSLQTQDLAVSDGRSARQLLRTGQLRGSHTAVGLSAPVLGAQNGLMYYSVLLDDGSTELVVQSGDTNQVILQSGDNVGSTPTTEILYGYHPTQVDSVGRLAFGGEFIKNPSGSSTDPSNILSSIVIGVPA
jgi:hypothetical protein